MIGSRSSASPNTCNCCGSLRCSAENTDSDPCVDYKDVDGLDDPYVDYGAEEWASTSTELKEKTPMFSLVARAPHSVQLRSRGDPVPFVFRDEQNSSSQMNGSDRKFVMFI